jgi:hypothetical protein
LLLSAIQQHLHGSWFWRAELAAATDMPVATRLRVLIPEMKISIRGKKLFPGLERCFSAFSRARSLSQNIIKRRFWFLVFSGLRPLCFQNIHAGYKTSGLILVIMAAKHNPSHG